MIQGTWTSPITSRLLLEAGMSWQDANWVNFAEDTVTQNDRSIVELTTAYRYGATTLLTAPKARTGRAPSASQCRTSRAPTTSRPG
ncbi:MAG: hypothetical protein QM736_20180 [Vicinamibacterales bacterium]